MKAAPVLAVIAAAGLALAACSMGHGFRRETTLAGKVHPTCIEDALRHVDGVSVTMSRDHDEKRFQVAPNWGPNNSTGRMLTYETAASGMIGISATYMERDATTLVQHVWGRKDRKEMTPAAIESALRDMLRVEEAVETACDIKLNMKTSCSDIDCAAIDAIVAEAEA